MSLPDAPADTPAEVMAAATRLLGQAVAGGDLTSLPDTALQALLAASVRAYAARVETRGQIPAFARDAATATDVAVTATAMLAAVDVGVFELGMWQTVKGPPNPRSGP